MRYLLIILLALLPGDDPPDSVKVDTIRIQQQKALEDVRGDRTKMDSLIMRLQEKRDSTKKK